MCPCKNKRTFVWSTMSRRMANGRIYLPQQIVLIMLCGGVFSSPTSMSSSSSSSTETVQSNFVSDPHALQNIIQDNRQILECCGSDETRTMNLNFLPTSTVTCNDGSSAGYYLRKSQHNSRIWIIFLEGGWYCYDQKSCNNRWTRLRHLMTSKEWPNTRTAGGILSPNVNENPFWYNANHVLVPYCSSDSWSGTRSNPPSSEIPYRFQGSEIVLTVVRQLIPLGLNNASSLILAGSSAGGTGVLVNVDRVRDLLHRRNLGRVHLRGIADSGWFLDRAPYLPADTEHRQRRPTSTSTPTPLQLQPLSPLEAIRRGWQLWNGRVPEACRSRYSNEPWRCYFGYRIYPTLKVPIFVFQWLFDEAQMTADNVGAPVTKQQWDFIHQMGDSLRNSFENVTAVFAPSCISHSVLTRRDWRAVRVDEISLPQALRCWETQSYSAQIRALRRAHTKDNLPMLGDAPLSKNLSASLLLSQERLRKKKKKQNNNNNSNNNSNNNNNNNNNKKGRSKCGGESNGLRKQQKGRRNNNNIRTDSIRQRCHRQRRRRRRRRRQRQTSSTVETAVCNLHLVERCTWPQCNRSCPKLHNPFTGEEMDFIELLKSFGLDMASVANALGIDLHTLDNMDPAELLSLLTQQAN